MSEGLEVSEVKLNKVKSTQTLRLDSDYYKKAYVHVENILNPNQFVSLSNIGLDVDASAFYPALEPYYDLGDIPFIRVGDVKDDVDYDSCVKLPKMPNEFNTLKMCKKGDIVLTKGGTIANAGLIKYNSYVTRDLIFINSSRLNEVDYICLYLYFRTNFAYDLMIRSCSYSVQPHLTVTLIRQLPIRKFSQLFKTYLQKFYNDYESTVRRRVELYSQAEALLLEKLNLQDYIPDSAPSNIVSFSNSFKKTGRLDAEYYHKKYEDIISTIKSNTYDILGNLVYIIKSIEPGSEAYDEKGVLPFLRVSDYNKYEIKSIEKRLSQDFVSQNSTIVNLLMPAKNTILFSKDGTLGIAYKLNHNAGFITSGAILHLSIKDNRINIDYLTLVLNSIFVKMQAERDSGGSIIQHWRIDEIKQVLIPIIDDKTQEKISDLVQQSIKMRERSKQLLSLAIKAVEMAIEADEDLAIKLLEEFNA